ncbi:MAG TPA: AbrB/MazE/SpoVT family DNA-binding domain-containing protein [Terriglobales bacterium]
MNTTHLRRVGGSTMLPVPATVLKALQLKAGARVQLQLEAGRLIVRPLPRPRYTLAELLAETPRPRRVAREDRVWTAGKAAGREVI